MKRFSFLVALVAGLLFAACADAGPFAGRRGGGGGNCNAGCSSGGGCGNSCGNGGCNTGCGQQVQTARLQRGVTPTLLSVGNSNVQAVSTGGACAGNT